MIQQKNLVFIESNGFSIDMVSSNKVKLEQFKQIDFINTNSFVVGWTNEVKTLNKQGKKINELKVQQFIKFQLINQVQAIVLSYQKQKQIHMMTVWNMMSKNIVQVQHLTAIKLRRADLQMFLFKKTNLICICQFYKEKNIIQLTYYSFPFYQQLKPMHRYTYTPLNQQKLNIIQLNSHSMLALIPSVFTVQNKYVKFYTYSLQMQKQQLNNNNLNVQFKNIKGKLISHEFEQWFSDSYDIKAYCISDICQIKSIMKLKRQKYFNKAYYDDEQYTSLYWDSVQKQIISSKININSQHRLQFIHYLRNFQTCRMLEGSKTQIKLIKDKIGNPKTIHQNVQHTTSYNIPIYYVNPQTQKILCVHPFKNKESQHTIWHYNHGTIMSYNSDLKQKGQLNIHFRLLPKQCSIYWQKLNTFCVWFLLQIIKQCDQDLLYFIHQIIPDDQYSF